LSSTAVDIARRRESVFELDSRRRREENRERFELDSRRRREENRERFELDSRRRRVPDCVRLIELGATGSPRRESR